MLWYDFRLQLTANDLTRHCDGNDDANPIWLLTSSLALLVGGRRGRVVLCKSCVGACACVVELTSAVLSTYYYNNYLNYTLHHNTTYISRNHIYLHF